MTLAIDPDSPAPLHRQVEQVLRAMLRNASYQDGKLLPPETQLAAELRVSRSTVRTSIDRLVREGLLTRKPGKGTWASPPSKRTSSLESWESFTREMARQGLKLQTFAERYGLRSATVAVAEALRIARGERVFVLERVRGFDDRPVVEFVSWFHPSVGLTGDEDFSRPLYEVLEEDYGKRAELSRERITAVTAGKRLAGRLAVTPGSPLLRRIRSVSDAGGRPIEYAVNHYCSDRFEYTIDITRGRP